MNYTYYRRYRPSTKRSSFKSFFWLVLVLVVALLVLKGCVSVISSLLKDKEDEATLTLNKGSARVIEWGQTEAQDVADAQLLLVGDTVQTAENSVVTLTFTNGTTVILDQNSKLTFARATLTDNDVSEELQVDLIEGRAFVKQKPEDEQELTLELHTDVMNIASMSASYLVSNQVSGEYLYTFDGQATANFVDRAQGDTVIEMVTLDKGKKAILTDEIRRKLLARESVTLSGEAGDDLIGDGFIAFVNGDTSSLGGPEEETAPVEETLTEDLPVEETPEVEPSGEDVSSLQIKVTSPELHATLQKSAIAIEGAIVAGTANTVTVTWDGNNQPYTLGGFAPGDTQFRYVADASYGNFKVGVNTFTVVATAADGTVSNTVTVVIDAEF